VGDATGLDAASNHSPQQVLAQTRSGRSSEHGPPAPPKGIKRKRSDAINLDRDRGRVCHLLAHGYAIGKAVGSGSEAAALPAAIR
jgi:hypothetical protein